MAASPTPRPTASNPCSAALHTFLATQSPALAADQCLGVALSGGADSSALLLAAQAQWPGRIQALHVHHGLQGAADDFAAHCSALCTHLGVPLQVSRVDARHRPGQSPEDAARQSRYRALAQAAQQQRLAAVLLAQHADDQVETLLLALSRGAGLPGLAAMPAQFNRHGMRFWRPLLAVPGPAIRQWLVQQGVAWVQDPSNGDERYTRNRIRSQLLPALEACFPQFRTTLARSAAHAAQAQELLQQLAEQDLAAVGVPPRLQGLQALAPERQAKVLRHWLKSCHGVAPAAAQLAELQRQLRACTTRGHRIAIKVGAGQVRRQGMVLNWYN